MSLSKSRIVSVSVSSFVGVALAGLLWPGAARAHFILGRLLVQVGYIDSLRGPKPISQHVPEQVVVSVPRSPVVQRDDKEIVLLQSSEDAVAVLSAGDGVAQRTR